MILKTGWSIGKRALRSKMREAVGAEVPEAKICFWAAAIDDKQSGACLATGFFFNLRCRPDTRFMTQAVGGEFLHCFARFEGFLRIHGNVDGVIEPGADLGVMSLVGGAGTALQDIAVAGAK